MPARSGRRSLLWAGVLGLAPLLLWPAAVSAIFPPVYHPPAPPPPTAPPPVINPPVQGGGNPDPPPVVQPPPHQTPEPATLVTGLVGLLCGGYVLRRKKKRASCGM
jgi:hypothetical protein